MRSHTKGLYNQHVWDVFDSKQLRRICEMQEDDFAPAFGLDSVTVGLPPADFFAYRDNGSKILAVAHLDTVAREDDRKCNFVKTAAGLVVHSRALDDRLGAYIVLDMLPKLGVNCDVLLTTGEESGRSTAQFFDSPKDYNWIIEFDRGGTDVVMYQYEDKETRGLVKSAGVKVGEGIFSDICYLDHLGVKAFNWGVGYQDYHSDRSHAYLEDTFGMVDAFLDFHAMNADTFLPHEDVPITLEAGVDDLVDDEEDYAEMQAWWSRAGVAWG